MAELFKWRKLLFEQFGPCSLLAKWHSGDLPQEGVIEGSLGAIYRFHGLGCSIEERERFFEFEFGPIGHIGGFDSWRLHLFAEDNYSNMTINKISIDTGLAELESKGSIQKIRLQPNPELFFTMQEAKILRKRLINEGLI